MLDLAVLATISAATASLSTIALRDAFARAAIKKACQDAEPDIARFKQDNTYVRPLSEEFLAVASVMRTTIGKARETRKEVIEKVKSIEIPNPDIPMDMQELERAMKRNNSLFIQVMKQSCSLKAQHLVRQQVQHRLKLAKRKAAERMAKAATAAAAGTATAAAAAASESAKDAYKAASEHVAPHLDILDKKIVEFLDQFGVIDLSVEIAQKVQDFVATHMGEAAGEHLGQASELLSGLHAIPGSVAGVKSVFREINMLQNDETSFGEAFSNGGIQIALKSIGIKAGMILDGMMMGLSFGAFTFLGSYFGSVASNAILEEKNMKLRRELQALKDEIDACHRKVMKAINLSVNKFEKEFARRVEACPDINQEPSLKNFIQKLVTVYNQGYQTADHQLAQNTRTATDNLPEDPWYYKVLFIDRRKAVRKMYLEAQREITSRHSGLVHDFSTAAQTHAEDAIDFMIQHVVFETPETMAALEQMESVTKASAESYTEHLTDWEKETTAYRKEGSEEVARVINIEGNKYKEFVRERKPIMSSIARRIHANNRRQGKSPSMAAA